MAEATVPATPELDRMRPIAETSRSIGEFLDWLSEKGIQLAKYESRTFDEVCPGPDMFHTCEQGRVSRGTHYEAECTNCSGTGYAPMTREQFWTDTRQPEQLLADYFGIDLTKVEAERRALLDHLREMQT